MALKWIRVIATAVEYLHEHALVSHADLSPTNVLLTTEGVVKVCDLGGACET